MVRKTKIRCQAGKLGRFKGVSEHTKTPRVTRGSAKTVLLPTGRILGPPLPGQGWLAGLTPSLDAVVIL